MTWWVKLTCDGKNYKNEQHEFDIRRNSLLFRHSWCKKCRVLIFNAKTPKQHESEIREYLEKHPERDMTKVVIHEIYQKKEKFKSKKNGNISKERMAWWIKITCEGIKFDGKNEKHTFRIRKDNIMKGKWCSICQERINAIGSLIHPIVEYYSLIILKNFRYCNAKNESFLEEGTRPDIIIQRNDSFKQNIELKLDNALFSKHALNGVKNVAIDFTISRKIEFIINKSKRHYQNSQRSLLIVLLYADAEDIKKSTFTAKFCQKKIENDDEITNRGLVRVINYEQYLEFLGLGNGKMTSDLTTEKEKEYREKFLKARSIAIAAIKSSKKMNELISLSSECEQKLEKEFSS
jgi:hypothetical protein